MRRIEVSAGMRFGKLTVLREMELEPNLKVQRKRKFLCQCECGRQKVVMLTHLRSGHTCSCGCLKAIRTKESNKRFNKYLLQDGFVVGYTKKGETFMVDVEDYERIKSYCWFKVKTGYLMGFVDGRKILLHRYIMNPCREKVVDHINHDVSDNRKSNLRVCTHQQNSMNKKVKGYFFNKQKNKWCACVEVKGKRKYLGFFDLEKDAAEARKFLEKKYFGEFAYEAMNCG